MDINVIGTILAGVLTLWFIRILKKDVTKKR
jgi:hypothetical protein